MNDRDAELIYGLLTKEGYSKASCLENANIILFNTCSIRKHAEDRVYGKVGLLKNWKKKNPNIIFGIVGCMAQSHKENIFTKLPHVDFICGPANIYDIPNLIKKVQDKKEHISALDKEQRPNIEQPALREGPVSASVSISEGCDNFCSYCIVPYVRGREQSRSKRLILDEVNKLKDAGCKEVILLGQNVNSYKPSFIELLEAINRVEGIERIRFVTSHPKDASRDLFKAMRGLSKVCEHLHLPLQSGSDGILKKMNRGYTTKQYLELVQAFRKIVPHSSLTTDIIVGFPGEAETDFKKTYEMMKEIEFDNAFIFKYSPRPPAKSCKHEDTLSSNIKKERNQSLLTLQSEISRMKNKKLIGSEQEVLVESRNRMNKAKSLCGRTRTNKRIVFDGSLVLLKSVINVKIEKMTLNTLIGEAICEKK